MEYQPDELHPDGTPNFPLIATRAGRAAKQADEPREAPEQWANSPYFTFWYAGYDL